MPILTFHIHPAHQAIRVMIAVTEGRTGLGEFEVTVATWERVRGCFATAPGLRVRSYPP